MKHLTSSSFLVLFILLSNCGPSKKDQPKNEPIAIPFDVSPQKEQLGSYYDLPHIKEWYKERILPPAFDYGIDLSSKSYMELVLLRNEIFARNGYLFKDAALRGYFNQFKWYQPLWGIPDFKVKLNDQEAKFVEKLLTLEREKLKDKYVTVNGNRLVSPDFVINSIQYQTINDSLMVNLRKMNFALARSHRDQLFYIYDENQYRYIPNFITTDIYLQMTHKFLSSLLEKVEERILIRTVDDLIQRLYTKSATETKNIKNEQLKAAASWANTYLAIASYTLNDSSKKTYPTSNAFFNEEIKKVGTAVGTGSAFLKQRFIDYSQFLPRGNYTKDHSREHYFRCIKWLNSASFTLVDDDQLRASLLIALWIKNDRDAANDYRIFDKTIGAFAGKEDGISLNHLMQVLDDLKIGNSEGLIDSGNLEKIRKWLSALKVDRIKPQAGNDIAKEDLSKTRIFFTAGRYTFDSEILSRLVHVLEPPKRPFPKGLDVFAALGSKSAESILKDEYQEAKQWPAYPDSLARLKQELAKFNEWDSSLYNKTMESIHSLSSPKKEYPLFMQTNYWQKKNLNTSLAAWSELKHDMLLYTEHAYAAEAGEGGGPPPPIHLSYVEPNVLFWRKALELLDFQTKFLKELNALDEHSESIIKDMKEIANFLLTISEKELNQEPVTEPEFEDMTWLGGRIERLTFSILETDHLPEREKQIALTADVYSFNQRTLQEGVGLGDEIYVIVEINGYPYLTKGACFSYYEFINNTPLTDEAWQERINTGNAPERPVWLNDLYVKTPSLLTKPSYSF